MENERRETRIVTDGCDEEQEEFGQHLDGVFRIGDGSTV